MSDRTLNYQVALGLIRETFGLPAHASPSQVVSKVRETKAAADLAGEALELQVERDSDDDLPARPRDLTGTRDHRIS